MSDFRTEGQGFGSRGRWPDLSGFALNISELFQILNYVIGNLNPKSEIFKSRSSTASPPRSRLRKTRGGSAALTDPAAFSGYTWHREVIQ
ncbi:hypothetical protein L596_004834 [Steinernema carpocapsae]|uniref:Uncharacterized protein n=1 Tax=Steinernema carpocapsae TaxID=34508 RepID=A0A4U8V177_STECR|nr:hypothetical protein L596_004834 [Steinernema carpocapsae]